MQGPLVPKLFPSSPVTENKSVGAGEVRWPVDHPPQRLSSREGSGYIPLPALRLLFQPYIGSGRRHQPAPVTAHLAFIPLGGDVELYDYVEIEHSYDAQERSVTYSLRARVRSQYTVSHIAFGAGTHHSAAEYGLLRLDGQRLVERGDTFSFGYRISVEVLEMMCA
jgi:hypothetical protein